MGRPPVFGAGARTRDGVLSGETAVAVAAREEKASGQSIGAGGRQSSSKRGGLLRRPDPACRGPLLEARVRLVLVTRRGPARRDRRSRAGPRGGRSHARRGHAAGPSHRPRDGRDRPDHAGHRQRRAVPVARPPAHPTAWGRSPPRPRGRAVMPTTPARPNGLVRGAGRPTPGIVGAGCLAVGCPGGVPRRTAERAVRRGSSRGTRTGVRYSSSRTVVRALGAVQAPTTRPPTRTGSRGRVLTCRRLT